MKRKCIYKPFNLRSFILLLFLPANIFLAQNKTVSGFVRKAFQRNQPLLFRCSKINILINNSRNMCMLKLTKLLSLACCLLSPLVSKVQSTDQPIPKKRWPSFWVAVPNQSTDGYGVFIFRKNIEVNIKPGKFLIYISADNRYKLFAVYKSQLKAII